MNYYQVKRHKYNPMLIKYIYSYLSLYFPFYTNELFRTQLDKHALKVAQALLNSQSHLLKELHRLTLTHRCVTVLYI